MRYRWIPKHGWLYLLSWKEPCGNVNGGRAVSMCRLTHVISSVPIKDHTIVGAFVEIERIPRT